MSTRPSTSPSPATASATTPEEVTFARERLDPQAADWERNRAFVDLHALELRGMPADLDLSRYLELQRQDRLVLMVARDRAGRPVGYCLHAVLQENHFGELMALDAATFVAPWWRGRGIGARLRELALAECREAGAKYAVARFKVAADHPGHMARLGFAPWEIMYRREL